MLFASAAILVVESAEHPAIGDREEGVVEAGFFLQGHHAVGDGDDVAAFGNFHPEGVRSDAGRRSLGGGVDRCAGQCGEKQSSEVHKSFCIWYFCKFNQILSICKKEPLFRPGAFAGLRKKKNEVFLWKEGNNLIYLHHSTPQLIF